MTTPRWANGSPGRSAAELGPDGGIEAPDGPDGVLDGGVGVAVDGDEYQDSDHQDSEYQDSDHQDSEHGDGDGVDGEHDSGPDVEPAGPLRAAAAKSLNGADASVRVQPEPSSAGPRRRRARHPGRKVLRRITWVVVCAAVLVGLAVGGAVLFPGLVRDTLTEVPQSVAAPLPSEAAFGQRLERSDGWTVEMGQPRAVRPNDDVDLPADADRGVLLDLVLTNTGAEARDTSGWTVMATVGGRPVEVLPDAAAPSRTVRPGASLTFPIAVPMPEGATDLQLEAAPAQGTPSLFLGTA